MIRDQSYYLLVIEPVSYLSLNILLAAGIKGSLKRQGVVLTVPSHKKQTCVVYPSPPSWKGGDQQDSRISMSDGEDKMDLDLCLAVPR